MLTCAGVVADDYLRQLRLLGPSNVIVITTLFVCALSVAGAIFLILELDQPFEGVIRISSAPLRNALAHLGQ
jgi:hypothetical protein